MQPEDRIRLRHLREAAGKALTYSDGKQRSDLDDELLRLALTKLVEIVGEDAKSISPDGRAASRTWWLVSDCVLAGIGRLQGRGGIC